ncbi:FtsX-like permease family protein [Paenibacillus thermoaerophilus]|uniref:FtsX-like permease family protein n=1 Tax=Paenibacillus thermoaerophilus TaxID=1215385 RepID=A0ABW2V210_9BACL|nr:ABC transporter permease [Paenibacillus thermoaerophilus]TMV17758.1 ABC transporter permease [Paenibacillus thermoaerophilus]
MAMLRFLFRKMWNTRWLTFSSLIGLTVAVAFTTSIPMYSDGALKRVVAKSLADDGQSMPPGSLAVRYQATGSDRTDPASFGEVDRYIREEVHGYLGLPYTVYNSIFSLRGTQLAPVDPTKVDASKRRQMTIVSMHGLSEHAELSVGRWPADRPDGTVLEAAVMEESLFRNDLHVGDEFRYPVVGQTLTVRIVGAFHPKDENDPYWFQGLESQLGNLVVSEQLFKDELMAKRKVPLSTANWYYAFDLTDIRTSQIGPLESKLQRLDINLYQKLKDTKVDFSFADKLGEFKRESLRLQVLLFTLAAPMIGMVLYYIVMNAKQTLDRQRTDISVIRSRGASTWQIVWLYVLESLVLGGAALILGTSLGWLMAKSIGSANGFLSFVDREAVPVGFGLQTVLYGAAAVLVAMAATVIPAIGFARSSIVDLKKRIARSDRKPVWQRWFLDVALVAVAGLGWYGFRQNRLLSEQTGLSADQLQVHPLLFFVPALTIFALGLVFLRVFPWIIALATRIGRRVFPVSIYMTLTQLSRSSRSYYPLMLLLILTLGLGVYNASAARTIDLNSTERTLYRYGTDVIVKASWESVAEDLPPPPDSSGGQGGQGGQGNQGGTGNPGGGAGAPGSGLEVPQNVRYIEPPFEVFKRAEGVEHASRVLQMRASASASGKSLGIGNLIGIDNWEFGNVAWLRRDLFPLHPYWYLNLLGTYEQAVIVPTKFADRYALKPGDLMNIAINQTNVEFVIVGTLPYWPAQYPDERPFFIANLEYIYDQAGILPYEVWIKMKEGAKTVPMLEHLQREKVEIAEVRDVGIELAAQQKHPQRGGVFGILSLGFILSVLISLFGFILYWFFNLSSRVVQFGVLRAMGLHRKQLTGMLLLEQLFTAGLSIGLGIGLGMLAGYLYLPFLQTADNAAVQVPPFRIVFEAKDNYPIFIVTAFMILVGATMLALHIRRLRVHQAVKLGEER